MKLSEYMNKLERLVEESCKIDEAFECDVKEEAADKLCSKCSKPLQKDEDGNVCMCNEIADKMQEQIDSQQEAADQFMENTLRNESSRKKLSYRTLVESVDSPQRKYIQLYREHAGNRIKY